MKTVNLKKGMLATLLAGDTAAPACCANQSRGVAFANGAGNGVEVSGVGTTTIRLT